MFGNLIKDELEKLALGMAGLTGLKHGLYVKADALLVEIENLSQEQIRSYAVGKRIELAEWAGEPSPVEVQAPPPADKT